MAQKYAVVKNGSNLQEIQAGDRLNGESTGVYFDTIALTSADIATLNSGFEVVPAQGTGTITLPTFATLQFTPGSEPFANNTSINLYTDAWTPLGSSSAVEFTSTTDKFYLFSGEPSGVDISVIENASIVLKASSNPGYTGSILTSSINNAGSGYAPGDTINSGTALITVNTVDGGGAVLTYTVTDAGSGLVVDTYVAGGTSGSGIGFEINVDSITPLSNGTASLYIEYKIIEVAA